MAKKTDSSFLATMEKMSFMSSSYKPYLNNYEYSYITILCQNQLRGSIYILRASTVYIMHCYESYAFWTMYRFLYVYYYDADSADRTLYRFFWNKILIIF